MTTADDLQNVKHLQTENVKHLYKDNECELANHLCIDASFLDTAQHYCVRSGQLLQHRRQDVPQRGRKSGRTSDSGCKVHPGLALCHSHSRQ